MLAFEENFPLFLPLTIIAFGAREGYFILGIIAFGKFEFVVPKYNYHPPQKHFLPEKNLLELFFDYRYPI